ncbi:hypothetical protein [Pararhodobacter sp.]|uniref:hypothetical protein n=1 Tax=Pararhodobacter sp. TaxID=2127056 RepID=UPI002FDC7B73
MRKAESVLLGSVIVFATAASAMAGVCNYRPSTMVGGAVTSMSAGAGTLVASSGAVIGATGYYTILQAGSSAIGASAAGALGAIAGTAGAILSAPATLVLGGVAGGLEAACYFTDERVTDYNAVLAFMDHLHQHHPEDRFRLVRGIPGRQDDAIRIWNPRTEGLDRYLVAELYIVNGTLMVRRRWGIDTNLGNIAFVPAETE